ncbi:MAG: glycosyltransferase family 4 protein [Planctomycetota bacterium]
MQPTQPSKSISYSLSQSFAPVVVTPTPVVISEQPSAATSLIARVLHLVNGEHFSGAERVQSHLGRCLPDYDTVADFACVKPGKFAELIDEQRGNWGVCHRVPMSSRFDLRAAWAVRQLVRDHEYHLLHAHTPRTAMIAALASRIAGVPWVYHVHSPAARDSERWLSNRFNAAIERASRYGCSHLITVSNSLRQDCLARGARPDRVTVVRNGVPTVRPDRMHTPTVGGGWTLGMIALMRPRKGLEVLLQALAKLRGKFDLTLRIIGPFETDSYEDSINQIIVELGIEAMIERVGFTQDVSGELAKLDAMVLPSLFGEGLPMVVLEAMAAAVPVIASRVEGTPEAVTDGVEGLLAQPNDPDSLAAKIRELVSGEVDWHTMSEAAASRHARDFSDVAMAERTAAVYRSILA